MTLKLCNNYSIKSYLELKPIKIYFDKSENTTMAVSLHKHHRRMTCF